jgi:hypothetical protein
VAADLHSTPMTAPLPPVAWITRALNDAQRAMSEARPASELCGEVAEFMGIFDDDED